MNGRSRRVAAPDCFVCAGLTEQVGNLVKSVRREAKKYLFHTFAIGLILPVGVQEREDELRAEWKVKGRETIKSELSRKISSELSRATRKRVDKLRPELSALIDLKGRSIQLTSRSAFVYGRYTKPLGLRQRRLLCQECGGRGCDKCHGTGYDQSPSLEMALKTKLERVLSCSDVKVSWTGSEDPESLVLPPGRPFVAEAKNPKHRRVPRSLVTRVAGAEVKLANLRVLPDRPHRLPTFRFRTRAYIETSGAPSEKDLKGLTRLRSFTTVFQRPGERLTRKTVYKIRATRSGREIVADLELDGGLPVKRFVSGEGVSPSLSELLKTELKCRKFDILKVTETSDLEFA
jgi:tRNA pseudouridine synthase 10